MNPEKLSLNSKKKDTRSSKKDTQNSKEQSSMISSLKERNSSVTVDSKDKSSKNNELPQTGENRISGILSLIGAEILTALGTVITFRKKSK